MQRSCVHAAKHDRHVKERIHRLLIALLDVWCWGGQKFFPGCGKLPFQCGKAVKWSKLSLLVSPKPQRPDLEFDSRLVDTRNTASLHSIALQRQSEAQLISEGSSQHVIRCAFVSKLPTLCYGYVSASGCNSLPQIVTRHSSGIQKTTIAKTSTTHASSGAGRGSAGSILTL